MEDSILFKISLLLAVIGITLLLLINEKVDIKNSNIASLTSSQLNQKVRIKGFATSIKMMPEITIIDVKDYTGKIPVIIFDPLLKIKQNSILSVEGKLKEYDNKLQIEAEEIKII